MKKSQIRILGVIDEDPFHYQTWSGSSHYFFSALQRNNYLFKAISAEPSKLVSYLCKLSSFDPDLRKWKFKYHISTLYYRAMRESALRKIKCYNDNDYNTVLQVGAWYDLTRRKNKLTVSYHDGNLATLLKSPYGYPQVRKSLIERALLYEKQLYARMDHIFPMSKWLADSFVNDFAVSPDRVTPVGAGINLPYLRPVPDKNYENQNILFVGKDWQRKGGQYLLEAFSIVRKEIKQATLTIAGPSMGEVPEGVTCIGPISKFTTGGLEKLLDEYERASIFVMPSLYEPFGIAFAEAMAHKLPCVGTDICAIPEIIDSGINGWTVPVRDSRLLAMRMIDLLKNSEMCREFGESAFRKYHENYRWDIVAEKIAQAIPA